MKESHTHDWRRRQNETSRGYLMSPYWACECGAARTDDPATASVVHADGPAAPQPSEDTRDGDEERRERYAEAMYPGGVRSDALRAAEANVRAVIAVADAELQTQDETWKAYHDDQIAQRDGEIEALRAEVAQAKIDALREVADEWDSVSRVNSAGILGRATLRAASSLLRNRIEAPE